MGTEALAWVAAVSTATAIILGMMWRSARTTSETLRANLRISNDMAENATRTAQRMQQALRVVSEEIATAKQERKAADRVIERAEKVIETGAGLEGLADAWEDLHGRMGR